MSLRDDVALYTELSGNDGNHTPVGIIGAYLDGYEKGKALEEKKTAHWIVEIWSNKEHHTCSECCHVVMDYEPCYHYCPYCGARMQGT